MLVMMIKDQRLKMIIWQNSLVRWEGFQILASQEYQLLFSSKKSSHFSWGKASSNVRRNNWLMPEDVISEVIQKQLPPKNK